MYKRMNWNGRRIIKIYLFTTRRSLAAWPWFFSTRRREVGGTQSPVPPVVLGHNPHFSQG